MGCCRCFAAAREKKRRQGRYHYNGYHLWGFSRTHGTAGFGFGVVAVEEAKEREEKPTQVAAKKWTAERLSSATTALG
ncbi:hypothetical protein B296_00032946 [Ensete ventricosum]|uniref:Uncharacterized protein n=1 Tax=Ensete ventricosum TaxID=4639 RepID=A0A427ACJ2_ENSVE|nr:hypothetical protein B296_00032946 [Ensete ventricosum]